MGHLQTTRREFLKTAAGAAAAAALPGCLGVPPSDAGMTAAAAIVKAADYGIDLVEVIEQGLALVPPPDVRGKRVVLKPNLVDLPRDGRPVVTNPTLLVAIAEAFRRRGAAEIIIADGPALQRDAVEIVDAAGLSPLLRLHSLRFVDLNHDDVVRVANGGSELGIQNLYLSATAYHADVLVTVPKMKTHHWAGVSLALKSMFGTLPGAVYGWPRNHFHLISPHKAVIDFNRTRTSDYCIVDGIEAMEGDGPIRGTALNTGVLVFGDNATAVDATCSRIMKLSPEGILYLRMAAGLLGPIGEANIEQRGESIGAVARPFAVVPHLEMLRT